MDIPALIDQYAAGPQTLREAVAGMTAEQVQARPIEGQWSTLEVVCHLADFEVVYLDRMKRVIVESEPPLRGGDPDAFAARLAYTRRNLQEELDLIAGCRAQMTRILRTLETADFQRNGIHNEAGPLSLGELLRRVTKHLPHHIQFIEAKRAALAHASRPR
jgi:uncharacterized damage-inducible protein DinB